MIRDSENIHKSFSNEMKEDISKQSNSPKKLLSYGEQDKFAYLLIKSIAVAVVILLIGMIIMLINASSLAINEFGFDFTIKDNWNPVEDEFGALAFLYGTIVTSFIAILIAAPISIGVALFINEVLPKKIANIVSLFVEMIAAIPSIVFGLWGIFFLGPFVKEVLSPILKEYLGFLPLFQGASFGIGILTAALILAIMITPTITSICREVLKTVPKIQKEAALALGATRFEMIKIALLKPSFSGLMGGVVLGLGRALGETMAVAMVIGNSAMISTSLFSPAATMASVIANEYAEADSDLHLSALCYIGLLLFLVTFTVNAIARAIVWKKQRAVRSKK
ncbi:putative phosphate transport system permease [Halobacteriovorax marinus SJ]|uniref:Phosphate transport system permease protein n=1 Tax=Halobacteriovorax marinus (strain ATCC BAA-682 / DSM 15412 / SJ) TaxID=862908 RepID=E1X4V5_HALMS|nr:phosphate ABC transporter permease subunit PstC [Halobacteriovorax marinus]CBW27181.1 putative phosphate transport system permease [Halobacteriovorax marinus SJ]